MCMKDWKIFGRHLEEIFLRLIYYFFSPFLSCVFYFFLPLFVTSWTKACGLRLPNDSEMHTRHELGGNNASPHPEKFKYRCGATHVAHELLHISWATWASMFQTRSCSRSVVVITSVVWELLSEGCVQTSAQTTLYLGQACQQSRGFLSTLMRGKDR